MGLAKRASVALLGNESKWDEHPKEVEEGGDDDDDEEQVEEMEFLR